MFQERNFEEDLKGLVSVMDQRIGSVLIRTKTLPPRSQQKTTRARRTQCIWAAGAN